MNRVFADTCYYIALCNPKDCWNAAAVAASATCHAHVLTTEYILLELGNYFCDPADRSMFLGLVDHLRADKHTTLLPASQQYLDGGLALFRSRPDKAWSLTDRISVSIMQDLRINDALSCDHHFEQAGYRLLM